MRIIELIKKTLFINIFFLTISNHCVTKLSSKNGQRGTEENLRVWLLRKLYLSSRAFYIGEAPAMRRTKPAPKIDELDKFKALALDIADLVQEISERPTKQIN
jgi:hypothetical protein